MRLFQLFQTPTSPDLLATLPVDARRVALTEPMNLPRVQSNEELSPSADDLAQRLALVQWASGMGIWELNIPDNALVWDDELHRLFGVPRKMGDLCYETWRARVLTDDLAAFEGVFQTALGNAGVREFTGDFRIRHDDGSVRFLSCHAWIERGPEGQAVRVLGVNRDITQTKVLEEALRSSAGNFEGRVQRQTDELRRALTAVEQAGMAKDEVLARLTREMRTPLNSVVAMARLLELRLLATPQDDEVHGLLTTLGQGADLLLTLVDDFLDFTQIEAGQLTLEIVPFNLSDLLAQSLDPLVAGAQARRVALRDNRHELRALPPLRGDVQRLGQILNHLVNNALKFTREGEVRVQVVTTAEETARQDGLRLVLRVRDSGPGVTPGEREKIFAPFYQGQLGKGQGSGLGLAICRELVTRMEGTLHVSGSPGEGATFTMEMWLPLAGVQPEVLPVTAPRVPLTGGNKLASLARVLVAEDHPLNQATIRKLLTMVGIGDCELVETGPAVLARLGVDTGGPRSEDVDLLLLDWHLPGLDGRAVTGQIRAVEEHHRQERLPIIAVTAGGPHSAGESWEAAGMDAYLAKPLEPTYLRKVLARWLTFVTPTAVNEMKELRTVNHLTAVLTPCDLTRLHSFYADSPLEAARLVKLFLEQAREQLGQLAADLDGVGERLDPMGGWGEVAHRLKGGAGDMGATGLWRLAAEAQELAEAGPSARAAQLMLMQAEFARVEAWLQAKVVGMTKGR